MAIPQILYVYGAGLAISVLIGLGFWSMIKRGLSSVLRDLFPHEEVWKFWERLIGLSIILVTVSNGIGFSYSENALTDKLLLLWSLMDHIQGPLEGILCVSLGAFVPLLFAYVLVVKRT